MNLRQLALDALRESDPWAKCASVEAIDPDAPDARFASPQATGLTPEEIPGRCARPRLVPPARVPQRSVYTTVGRGALIHSLAHIELNAVNLALDISWRFDGLPEDFYRDWLGVARDEAAHFGLLGRHLRTLGFAYGDFAAHDGLWEMARKTSGDLLARLALVPRTLEARGLDAAPLIRDKLRSAGDEAGAAILEIILSDEIGHVAIGNRWFRWLCEARGLDPLVCYADLAERHQAPRPRGPFNVAARRAAGFSDEELAALQAG